MKNIVCECMLGIMLLFCAFSKAQTSDPPSQSATAYDELREPVWKTYLNWNRSGEILSAEERKRADEDGEIDIPSKYWAEPIKALKPVRVYSHLVNIAIVLRMHNNVEEGMYFLIPVSSYLPRSGDFGFEFTPNPQHGNIYQIKFPLYFKRTRNK